MSQHVLIIGGGVIGLCAAHYCQARGFRVTLIERQPAERDGCSFGNAGMIVPSHFVPLAAPGMVALGLKWMWNPKSPFYIKPRLSWDLFRWAWRFWKASTASHVERAAPLLRDLHLASRALYEELANQMGNEFGLVKNGLLMLCKTRHALDDEAKMAEKANKLGVPAQVLDAAGTAALDPGVRMDVEGSVFFPRDCHLNPQRLVSGLQSRLAAAGCEFHFGAEVTAFETRGRAVYTVRTTAGDFSADHVVLAGGSWSTGIGKSLKLSLPMQPGKGYSVTLTEPRQLPSICAIFTEARVAVTPMNGTLRFGGTMEMSGLNDTIRPARVQGIIDAVPKYYPDFQPSDFADLKPWHGLRPCSPDGLPYLGRSKAYDNLIVATGHAMMGLSLAPITGQVVAQLASGKPPGIELSMLSPDRYG